MATVTAKLSESLLGAETAPDASFESRTRFLTHAQQDDQGQFFMTEENFINAIAPADEDYHKIKREQYSMLFHIADRQNRGRILISEYAAFENLLSKADAEYEIAFRLFDNKGSGIIDFEEFKKTYDANVGGDSIRFDWNCGWAKLYLGAANNRHGLTYPMFAQMMRGLVGERIRQFFNQYDKDNDGFIEPEEFEQIIRATSGHKLSDHILDNLSTLCNISAGSKISYANVRAFQNIMRDVDFLDVLIHSAIKKSQDGKIDRIDFMNAIARSTRFTQYSPMEVDILFHFAGLDAPSGRLGEQDFAKVVDSTWQNPTEKLGALAELSEKAASSSNGFLYGLLESVHHFGLGAIAGAFGAFMVYPIDLVKTRMQNQRSSHPGSRMYNNSIDCARKVIRNEGFRGLYSGVLPQLVGVAPEKAIKLTVNDLVRGYFTNKETNQIKLSAELLAGGSAGACQVVFTNPLEIVKIRLQVQGELAKTADAGPKRSAMWIVRNLGIIGLYKGASACLLRDVPFSAIYFPAYNHLKRDFFGESPTKKLGVLQLLTAGAIAGMPAAYLTTPCDVIKTRLQVEARKGDATYNGLVDCARKVYRDEGFKAFFKGGPARIMRSSPQFGFTLAAYEVLSTALPLPGHGEGEGVTGGVGGKLEPSLSGLKEATAPLPYLRSRNALKIILDIDPNFGKLKIPTGSSWVGGFGLGGKKQETQ